MLYESWDNPFVARFVDKDGNVIYSETFTKSDPTVNEPDVPYVEGYVGEWEAYQARLNNATADVTIKPIYVLEEYVDQNPNDNVNDDNHIHLDSTMTAEQLFSYLAQGKSVIMTNDLAYGEGKKEKIQVLCVIPEGETDSRLNLNTCVLTCYFQHKANDIWHVFKIQKGAHLTISGGANLEGTLTMNFVDMNKNAHGYIFGLNSGSKLTLEAGTVIEVIYPKENEGRVSAFGIIDGSLGGTIEDFDNYTGIYVQHITNETNSDHNTIRITVGVTSTIEYDGTNIIINGENYTSAN